MAYTVASIKTELESAFADAETQDQALNRLATAMFNILQSVDVSPAGTPPLNAPTAGGPVTGLGKLV